MAFHPLHSFRKYDKFWMALMILVAMVTFVLCSGQGGDLMSWVSKWIGRHRGQEIAVINGSSWYETDLADVRGQRNIANDFMRKASEELKAWFDEQYEKEYKREVKGGGKADDERMMRLGQLDLLRKDLAAALKKPRYFDGGTKLDDLVDFVLWQQQADKLGINLTTEDVGREVRRAIYADIPGLPPWDSRRVEFAVREAHYTATPDFIVAALHKEFRARIAKLAMMGAHPQELDPRFRGAPALASQEMQVRVPLSPDQMWDYYGKNMVGFDVALVPVEVKKFMDKVPEPTEAQLQTLFEERRKMKFDPTSPTSGFEIPARVKVSWATADPESKFYRSVAHLMTALEQTPPAFWTPMLPGLGEAVRYAAGGPAWRASLERNYENLKANNPRMRARYQLSHYHESFTGRDIELPAPLTDPYFALPVYTQLYRPAPAEAAATVGAALLPDVGGITAPALYQTAAYKSQEKELEPAIQEMAKKRLPVGITLLLSAAGPTPLPVTLQALYANREPQYLPFEAVRGELREQVESQMASRWAVRVMEQVKDRLDRDKGIPEGFKVRLERLEKQYDFKDWGKALEVRSTDKFVNQYSAADDPALQGFKQSFERYATEINQAEGRSGTEKMLKEDDFAKLFFDPAEPFAIANAVPYSPQMWPPVVKVRQALRQPTVPGMPPPPEGPTVEVNLWREAAKPILFWKTEAERARTPASLDEVRDKVVEAWKMQEARKLALPAAEKIGEALKPLQVTGGPYLPLMQQEAGKLNEDLIKLDRVAPLVPGQGAFHAYGPYQLPRGRFRHPRPDMVKDVLAMNDLQQPLKTGQKDLDEVNKKLFDKDIVTRKLPAKQVQVLTTKDESVFYVTAVVQADRPQMMMFQLAYLSALRMPNTLIDQAQEKAAKDFRTELIDQMRRDAKVDIRNRGNFDQDGGS